MNMPPYHKVEQVLQDSGCVVDAAECHGVLCGIVCASGASDMQGWVRYLFENRENEVDVSAKALGILHQVHQSTISDINNESLEFSLLLPDDDEDMQDRIRALSNWCSGFSFGLTLGGLNDQMLEAGDTREFVEDLQFISDAEFGTAPEEDQDEESLTEIEEYVRMGVLLLNDELQPTRQSPTIH